MDIDRLLDSAFKKAKLVEKAAFGRKKTKERIILKIQTFSNVVYDKLNNYLLKYPMITGYLEEFVKIKYDINKIRKYIASLIWAKNKIRSLAREYIKKVKSEKEERKIVNLLRSFYGRSVSILKRIKDKVEYLNEVLRFIKEKIPEIEEKKKIFVLGPPKAGKSTFLKMLTGKKSIKVADYAFTTKKIDKTALRGFDIQLFDTPGILRDKFEDMNEIEKLAYVACGLADYVIFILDPTEIVMTIDDQIKLINSLPKKPNLIIISKKDLIDENKMNKIKKKVKGIFMNLLDEKEYEKIIEIFRKEFS